MIVPRQRLWHRFEGKASPNLRRLLARIEVHARTVQLVVRRPVLSKTLDDPDAEMRALERRLASGQSLGAEAAGANLRLMLDCRMKVRGGKTVFVSQTDAKAPTRSRPDRNLIRALKLAHGLIATAGAGPLGAIETLRIETAPTNPCHRNLMRPAFLAPDQQDAILAGTQAPGLNLQRLMDRDLPPSWEDQRAAFGA